MIATNRAVSTGPGDGRSLQRPAGPAISLWLPLALVTGLALALRLYQLGAEGLTPDEGISIQHVRDFHLDRVRPLYFLMLWPWARLGDSVAMLRLPSALMGAATVPLVGLLGYRLFGARAGIIAALLVAVSPLHLNHSQEVRMYAQMSLLAVASFLFFHRFLEAGKAGNFLAYGACTMAALLTQPICLFLLVAQNVYLLVWWRRHRRLATWWLFAQVAVVLLALPFILEMAGQASGFAQDWASTRGAPGVQNIIRLVSDLSFWKRSLWLDLAGQPASLVYYALLLGALGLLCLAPVLMRGHEPQVTLALAWLLVPLLCGLAVSYTVVNIWQVRYLIYLLPAYALLIGFSADRLASRLPASLPTAMVAGIALAGLAIDARYFTDPIRADWRGAMAYISAHRQAGDGFGVYTDQAGPAFGYYFDRELGASPVAAAATSGRAKRFMIEAGEDAPTMNTLVLPEGSDWAPLALEPRVFRELTESELETLFAGLPPGRPRYWLFLTHHGHRGGASIKQYAEQRYEVLDRQEFLYIELLLFRPE